MIPCHYMYTMLSIIQNFKYDTTSMFTSPQLIEIPSLALSPVAPVLLSRSEPARSTKWNLALSCSQSTISPDPEEEGGSLDESPSCPSPDEYY